MLVLSLTAVVTVVSGVPALFQPSPYANARTASSRHALDATDTTLLDQFLTAPRDGRSDVLDSTGQILALLSAQPTSGFIGPAPTRIEDYEPTSGLTALSRTSARGGTRPREEDGDQAGAGRLIPGQEPSPPVSAPEREPLQPFTYQVMAGDTVQGLASRFGISAETIVWANSLPAGGEQLQIGQSLVILPVSGVLHKVHEGDTLLALALTYEVEPTAIAEAGLLKEPYLLSLGQQLVIPGGRPAVRPAAPPLEHVVARGESLRNIALMHAVDMATIIRVNGLRNPDILTVGARLSIPGGQPAVALAASAPAPRAPAPVAPAPQPRPQPQPAAPAPQAAPVAAASAPEPVAEASGDGSQGEEIAARALEYVGYRYTWGGHSPNTGFDCSGFTWYVYQQSGLNIPLHNLWGQIGAGPKVSRDQLQPGDLVFFQNTYQPGLSHSGIYIGGGRFVNAVTAGVGVQVRSIYDAYWANRWFGASRPW